MKVGYISQWFPPEGGSAALPGTIARALNSADFDVSVITAFPNYPDGVLYEGWRQRLSYTESFGPVTVFRTPIYVSHDERAIPRIANYVSFAFSATLTAFRRLRNVDVIWVHATPILPALPAIAMRSVFGIPYVLHIQDLWPDTVLASNMLPPRLEPLVRKPLEWFCNYSYKRAEVVGVIAPSMRETLVERGVPDEKIVDIANWADEDIFHPADPDPAIRRSWGSGPDDFIAVYAGAIGDLQGLETVVEAAFLLRDKPNIQIIIVGDGYARPRLENLAESKGLTNLKFVGRHPVEDMTSIMATADAQIVCLRDLPLYRITLPSKVQASLAAGRPIVVSAGGDAGHVVREAKAGLAVEPGDPGELAKAIATVANMTSDDRASLGNAAHAHYKKRFGESVGVARMTAAIRRASRGRTFGGQK